jgi:hypothetical protein
MLTIGNKCSPKLRGFISANGRVYPISMEEESNIVKLRVVERNISSAIYSAGIIKKSTRSKFDLLRTITLIIEFKIIANPKIISAACFFEILSVHNTGLAGVFIL